MLVWDYEQGREIDDERGTNGYNRPDVSDAWIMAHALDDEQSVTESLRQDLAKMTRERNLAQDHTATVERVATELIETLAEHARNYSIAQELCQQYERFLSSAVGEVRETFANSAQDANNEMWNYTRGTDEYSVARSSYMAHDFGRRLVETFVRNASRVRQYVVTAPVTVTTRTVGRFAPSIDNYEPDYQIERLLARGESVSVSNVEVSNVVTSDGETLSYEAAQEANENYYRRQSYTRD